MACQQHGQCSMRAAYRRPWRRTSMPRQADRVVHTRRGGGRESCAGWDQHLAGPRRTEWHDAAGPGWGGSRKGCSVQQWRRAVLQRHWSRGRGARVGCTRSLYRSRRSSGSAGHRPRSACTVCSACGRNHLGGSGAGRRHLRGPGGLTGAGGALELLGAAIGHLELIAGSAPERQCVLASGENCC